MPSGDHNVARRHRAWLAKLPLWTGKQLTTIAKMVGVAPSTLTRPAGEGELGTSVLRVTTIEKIIVYFARRGIAIPWPEGEHPSIVVPLRAPPGLKEEAAPFDMSVETPLAAAVRAMVSDRTHVMPVTLQTRAIEGAGYLRGDILIYDLNGAPQAGDVVRAQVYDRNGEIEETVWRIYDPPYLVGLTRDLAIMPKPLTEVPGRVVIMGTVIGMIRPNRRQAA